MAHVFISYSSKHRALTEEIAAYLESCGLDVWWDRELVARSPFDGQIQEQLRTAGCVVVLWSEGAVSSEWVQIEAQHALENDILVNAREDDLDPARIPDNFRKIDAHKARSERDLLLRDVLAVREGRLLLEDKQEALPAPEARMPTMLLQAKFGVVPFVGGDAVKRDNLDWALSKGAYGERRRRAAGRLVHGSGGLGKTRLLIEIAAALRDERWSAGFLARPDGVDDPEKRERKAKALDHFIQGATDQGLLLIMDYAEGRADEVRRLAAAIQARPPEDLRPIRLVLLSRGAGDWWTRLIEEDPTVQALFGGERLDAHAMQGVTTLQDRLELFTKAVDAFRPRLAEMGYSMAHADLTAPTADLLRAIETNAGFSPGEGYDRPLSITMEALLYLAAQSPAEVSSGVHGLLASLLGFERSHWEKIVALPGDSAKKQLRRAVGQVTAVQGVKGRRSAETLLMADGRYTRPNRDAVEDVADSLSRLYGRDGGIAPLEPDLVGEHHVGLVADEELLDGSLAWIESEDDAQRRSARRRDLLTVLQRASRPEHGPAGVQRAHALLDHVIITHSETLAEAIVSVMQTTHGALFECLEARIDTLPEPALHAINFALPLTHVSWSEFSLLVAERAAAFARSALAMNTDEIEVLLRAGSAFDLLSIRLSNLGHLEEALTVSQEAVAICWAHAKERPDVFLPNLPIRLSNLGLRLSDLGRSKEALAALQKAVGLDRALAEDCPEVFLPNLASSLTNLGIELNNLGRSDEALTAAQEAVEIFRTLATDRPSAFLPDLATSLANLGTYLDKLGRSDEALKTVQKAVEIMRALAKDRPDAFLPDLSRSLTVLGNCYTALSRSVEALTADQEAVEIMRALAKDRPGAFLPDLSRSLTNLGTELNNLGRSDEALTAAQEAVEIFRTLATNRPDAFLPDLAMSLTTLGVRLSDLGRREDALAASQEAVELLRALVKERPDASLPNLALSLHNLGDDLRALGRSDEALRAFQEAVEVYRALVRDRSDSFLPDLAESLSESAQILAAKNKAKEAAECAWEGLTIMAPIVEAQPRAFEGPARALTRVYVQACEQTGGAPDNSLLEPVARALGDEELVASAQQASPPPAPERRSWFSRWFLRKT